MRERAACESLDRLLSLTRPGYRETTPGEPAEEPTEEPAEELVGEPAGGRIFIECSEEIIGSYRVGYRRERRSSSGLTTIDIKRAHARPREERPLLVSAEAVEAVARDIYGVLDDDREHFVIVALDSRRGMLGYKVIASGGRVSVEVDPRVLFVSALLLGASSFIALHNHPSGDPTPSKDDISLTIRLQAIGRLLDIPLDDHMIFCEGACHSLRGHTR